MSVFWFGFLFFFVRRLYRLKDHMRKSSQSCHMTIFKHSASMSVFVFSHFNEEVLLKCGVFFGVRHMIMVPKSRTLGRGDKGDLCIDGFASSTQKKKKIFN